MAAPRTGIIESIENYQQKVRTDDGQVMYFNGMTLIKDAKVGDRVTMTYHTGSCYGLWFGTVDKS